MPNTASTTPATPDSTDLFDVSTLKGADIDEATFTAQFEAVKADYAEIQAQGAKTTFHAAVYVWSAIKHDRLAIKSGGDPKQRPATMMTAEAFGAQFIGANGKPVSSSTVGLWVNLAHCLFAVKGFEYNGSKDDKHAKLWADLVSSGAGTSARVKEAIRGSKTATHSATGVAKALKDELAARKAAKDAKDSPTPAGGTDEAQDEDANKDGDGNVVAVAAVGSAFERAKQAINTLKVALPDMTGKHFQQFERLFTDLAAEVQAAHDSGQGEESETDKEQAEHLAASA